MITYCHRCDKQLECSSDSYGSRIIETQYLIWCEDCYRLVVRNTTGRTFDGGRVFQSADNIKFHIANRAN
jgi:hypothetical protein